MSKSRDRDKDATAPEQLVGRKYLKVLRTHLKRLRKADAHPNRVLHYDDLLTLLLLGFFNPTLRSLRTLEDASAGPRFRDCLDVERACRSTIADATACLDPALLKPLIDDLRRKVPDLPRTDRQLQQLFDRCVAVDGSLFTVAGDVAWALRKRKSGRGAGADDRFVRLDLQYCCATGTVEGLEINGKGTSETTAARRRIEPGALYVADRGIFSFAYVRDLLAAPGADFVLRIKASQRLEVVGENPLTPQQRAAGVLADRRVRLSPSQPGAVAPDQVLREVVVFDARNPDRPVRLLTSLASSDVVGAEVVGEVYRWRWQIELFFRWLKVHANFRHVISHSRNGLTLSFYVAVIGRRAADVPARRPPGQQVRLQPPVLRGPGAGEPGWRTSCRSWSGGNTRRSWPASVWRGSGPPPKKRPRDRPGSTPPPPGGAAAACAEPAARWPRPSVDARLARPLLTRPPAFRPESRTLLEAGCPFGCLGWEVGIGGSLRYSSHRENCIFGRVCR